MTSSNTLKCVVSDYETTMEKDLIVFGQSDIIVEVQNRR